MHLSILSAFWRTERSRRGRESDWRPPLPMRADLAPRQPVSRTDGLGDLLYIYLVV